jgi:hypothetical protein
VGTTTVDWLEATDRAEEASAADVVPPQPTYGYHGAVTFSKLTNWTKISARSARDIFLLGVPGKWQAHRHADTDVDPMYVPKDTV